MKSLKELLILLIVALVAAVTLGVVVTGRQAARDYYAQQALVAPRTLHQMTLEMDAARRPQRGNTLLWGAALGLAAVTVFGGMVFAMQGGTSLLREARLGRKRKGRRGGGRPRVVEVGGHDDYPTAAAVAPAARAARYLPGPEPEPYYLPEGSQNYANEYGRHDDRR